MAADSDRPRVHSINCFVFSVPKLEEAARFYEAFGLRVVKSSDGLELYTHGNPHRWAVIHPSNGSPKKLEYLSFGCYDEDRKKFDSLLQTQGYETRARHRLAESEKGLWLQHPDGFPLEITVAAKSSPDFGLTPSAYPPAEPRSVAPGRSSMRGVKPRRLSHVLVFSPDVSRSVRFFETVLGLRLSDRSGDGIAFMHGAHGSDHHLIAIAKSAGTGLHHCSWDVSSIDEVGAGIEQMRCAGYAEGWGLGRHVLGSNYFYYARDPWGSYCEYSYDIDYIPKGHQWVASDHPLSDSFYLWGPPVPPDFVTNHEVNGA